MSFVIVARDALAAAAADLAQIGSAVNAGNLAAANPTTAVAAAAADEVSAALAALFGAHAREYQAAAAQAAAYHEQFVHRLSAAATSYAVTEVTIATSLRGALGSAPASVSDGFQAFVYGPIHATGQQWINSPVGEALAPIVNAPTNVLLGRDLIGNGVTGTAAAPNGGPGGLLFGDGGAGYTGGKGGSAGVIGNGRLLYTSPRPRDQGWSRMPAFAWKKKKKKKNKRKGRKKKKKRIIRKTKRE